MDKCIIWWCHEDRGTHIWGTVRRNTARGDRYEVNEVPNKHYCNKHRKAWKPTLMRYKLAAMRRR